MSSLPLVRGDPDEPWNGSSVWCGRECVCLLRGGVGVSGKGGVGVSGKG